MALELDHLISGIIPMPTLRASLMSMPIAEMVVGGAFSAYLAGKLFPDDKDARRTFPERVLRSSIRGAMIGAGSGLALRKQFGARAMQVPAVIGAILGAASPRNIEAL